MHKGNYFILGIQSFANQDSGAALLKCGADGKLLDYIAIEEERLIRKKYPYVFPVHSIGYCMDHFGLTSLDQIDILMTDYIQVRRWFNSGLSYRIGEYDYLKLKFAIDPKKIRTIRHHEAHAAAAYYTSGFNDAAVLIVDGIGSELETTSYFCGKGTRLSLIENYAYRGIGGVYSAVTKNILNLGTGGEGKTMGLAPYGEKYKPVLNIHGALRGIETDYSSFMRRRPYSDVFDFVEPEKKIDPIKIPHKKCVNKEDVTKPYFARVAFEVQAETERALTHLARDLYEKTHSKNLCVAGGVGLNSVSNKIMLDRSKFEDIYIFPACADAGIPFGLALWGYYNVFQPNRKKTKISMKNAYVGKMYEKREVASLLKKYRIPHQKTTVREVAMRIAEGKIIGWFQGGCEYGPRALGHRSILADSRRAEMKDIVNERIKHRESYRPFAPAVLLERASDYFALDGRPSPFMLLVAKVIKPEIVPSITHVDHTARVQTVTKEENGIFYDLVKAFGEHTGVPCILNTSFNDAGEPIVETPLDAMACFLRTDMDYLVIGDELIEAKSVKGKSVLVARMERDRIKSCEKRYRLLIQRFFPGYDMKERENFIAESNKMSKWHAKYRAKYELEKKVMEWYWGGKRILIIGTPDHTAALRAKIPYFDLLSIVGFHHFEKKNDATNASLPYRSVSANAIRSGSNDEILISSHEYQPEIERYIRKLGIKKPLYAPYDTMGRSLMEVLKEFPNIAHGDSNK